MNEQGKTTPAEPSGAFTGWDLEATLDVSMISVACPHCKILVVEAKEPAWGIWRRPTLRRRDSERR